MFGKRGFDRKTGLVERPAMGYARVGGPEGMQSQDQSAAVTADGAAVLAPFDLLNGAGMGEVEKD